MIKTLSYDKKDDESRQYYSMITSGISSIYRKKRTIDNTHGSIDVIELHMLDQRTESITEISLDPATLNELFDKLKKAMISSVVYNVEIVVYTNGSYVCNLQS